MTTDLLRILDFACLSERQSEVSKAVSSAALAGRLAIVGSAELPTKCMRGLAAAGCPVRLFIEYESKYCGQKIDGVPVVTASEAFAILGPDALVIDGVWSPNHAFVHSRRWLEFHGFSRVMPVQAAFWTAARFIGPHYQFGDPMDIATFAGSAAEIAEVFAEEESRRQYEGHLRWRATLDSEFLPEADKAAAYFGVPFLPLPEDANIVDVGAFDGDSLRSFLFWRGRCRMFHALEPDPISFGRLTKYIADLPRDIADRIQPERVAVGAKAGSIQVSGTGKPGSQVRDQGGDVVPCIRLSDRFDGEKIDFMKFDIEGAEHDALAGAWDVVSRDRPALAVAIYHRPADIVDLPLTIMRHTPGYRYYLRSHDEDGIDLVFYAIPEH